MNKKLTMVLVVLLLLIGKVDAATVTQKVGEKYISQTVNEGRQVRMKFINKTGYTFTKWTVESGNVSIDTTNPSIEFTMPSSNVIIRGNYEEEVVNVITTVNIGGTVLTSTSAAPTLGLVFEEPGSSEKLAYVYLDTVDNKVELFSTSATKVELYPVFNEPNLAAGNTITLEAGNTYYYNYWCDNPMDSSHATCAVIYNDEIHFAHSTAAAFNIGWSNNNKVYIGHPNGTTFTSASAFSGLSIADDNNVTSTGDVPYGTDPDYDIINSYGLPGLFYLYDVEDAPALTTQFNIYARGGYKMATYTSRSATPTISWGSDGSATPPGLEDTEFGVNNILYIDNNLVFQSDVDAAAGFSVSDDGNLSSAGDILANTSTILTAGQTYNYYWYYRSDICWICKGDMRDDVCEECGRCSDCCYCPVYVTLNIYDPSGTLASTQTLTNWVDDGASSLTVNSDGLFHFGHVANETIYTYKNGTPTSVTISATGYNVGDEVGLPTETCSIDIVINYAEHVCSGVLCVECGKCADCCTDSCDNCGGNVLKSGACWNCHDCCVCGEICPICEEELVDWEYCRTCELCTDCCTCGGSATETWTNCVICGGSYDAEVYPAGCPNGCEDRCSCGSAYDSCPECGSTYCPVCIGGMGGTCIDCAYKNDDEAPAYDVCSCGTPLAACSECGSSYCPVDIGYCTNCEDNESDEGNWDDGWYATGTCDCGATLSTCSKCGSGYCPDCIGDCFCE